MMKQLLQDLLKTPHLREAVQAEGLLSRIAGAQFSRDLLEADEPLWGSFWQGDVIAPGYRLPAVELAFLRAVRLDQTWPAQTRLEDYLADLRAALASARSGVWVVEAAGAACLVTAAPGPDSTATVVWFCASTGCLHAGYRGQPPLTTSRRTITLRPYPPRPETASPPPGWIRRTVNHPLPAGAPFAVRLDREILHLRLKA